MPLKREVPVKSVDALTEYLAWTFIGTGVGFGIVTVMFTAMVAFGAFDAKPKAARLATPGVETTTIPDRLTLCDGCFVINWRGCDAPTYTTSVARPVWRR